jgi:acyl-coenzyme A synthetase/AMP-(fatty) acid ligase
MKRIKINWFKYFGLLIAKNLFIESSDMGWMYALLLTLSMLLLSMEVYYD